MSTKVSTKVFHQYRRKDDGEPARDPEVTSALEDSRMLIRQAEQVIMTLENHQGDLVGLVATMTGEPLP